MCSEGTAVSTFADLRRAGLTRGEVARALDRGSLRRVRRGVYAAAGVCDDALGAVAHGGILGCVSAASHLGLWVLDTVPDLHVWMRHGGHRYDHRDCGCVEHWDDGAVVNAFGTPSVPRILRQILGCCGVEQFFVVLESALRNGMLDARGLRWLDKHTNAVGREAVRLARRDADSGLESLLRWRLRRYRMRVRTQAVIIAVGRVDLLIGDRLIVEADGRDNHEGLTLRHKDLVRDAHAAAQGYTTLRFDYALIVHQWALVEHAILAQIGLARHKL